MTSGFSIYVPEVSGPLERKDAPKAPAPTDTSFLAELWNSGPIGRATALQIADLSKQEQKK